MTSKKILVIGFGISFLIGLILLASCLCPAIGGEDCINDIATKLKIDPTRDTLMDYVEGQMHVGMTRVEVQNTLEEIAPITVSKYYAPPGKTTDQIVLHLCNSPLSNLVYLADYSSDDTLQSFEYLPLDQ